MHVYSSMCACVLYEKRVVLLSYNITKDNTRAKFIHIYKPFVYILDGYITDWDQFIDLISMEKYICKLLVCFSKLIRCTCMYISNNISINIEGICTKVYQC